MTLRLCSLRLAILASFAFAPAVLSAADHHYKAAKAAKSGDAESVEMFDAIAQQQIEVKFIPKDSSEANVVIKNKTGKPLSVKLPDAFAGVPVLAQAAGAGAGRAPRAGGANAAAAQPMGGGMGMGMGGGMGMGMGGMGGGGGFFNVAPEQVGQFKVQTVCLEHGKPEPRAAIPYEIQPIDSYTSDSSVQELCRMIGSGQLSQRAAQVAAWHLNSKMSFEQLAAKQLRFADGTSRPYFTQEELMAGMQIAKAAIQAGEARQKSSETYTSGGSN